MHVAFGAIGFVFWATIGDYVLKSGIVSMQGAKGAKVPALIGLHGVECCVAYGKIRLHKLMLWAPNGARELRAHRGYARLIFAYSICKS